jgi:hypothetical protein
MLGKDLLPKIKSAGRKDRLSENLMKFVRKNRGIRLFVAFATEGKETYDASKTQASRLYIGFWEMDDGWLHGARLSEILCEGARASTWAYPPKMRFIEVSGWFDRYAEGGKCVVDPEHRLYHDRERWQEDGDIRRCLWCGDHQQVKHRYQVEREEWRNEEPLCA